MMGILEVSPRQYQSLLTQFELIDSVHSNLGGKKEPGQMVNVILSQ